MSPNTPASYSSLNSAAPAAPSTSIAVKRAAEKATFPHYVSAMLRGRAYRNSEQVESRPVPPGATLRATDRNYTVMPDGSLRRDSPKQNRKGDTRRPRERSQLFVPHWRGNNKYDPQTCSRAREQAANREHVVSIICPDCGGTGSMDSGGITPWGSFIMVPCPSCAENNFVTARGPFQQGSDALVSAR